MQCLGNWNLSAKVMFKAWCQCAKSCLSVRGVLKPNGQLERAGADAGPQGRGGGGLQGAGQGWCANLTGHTGHSGYRWCGGLRTTVGRSRAVPAQWGLGGQNRRRERGTLRGRMGARRLSAVAFRGWERLCAYILTLSRTIFHRKWM